MYVYKKLAAIALRWQKRQAVVFLVLRSFRILYGSFIILYRYRQRYRRVRGRSLEDARDLQVPIRTCRIYKVLLRPVF